MIEAIPSYKNNKLYGGLISMTPPFNIIAFFLLPIYHCKDKNNLEKFNSKVCKVTYFPLAVFFTIVFLCMNLIITPFAWIKVVIHKILLARRLGKKYFYCESALYFFLGLPILIISAIIDCKWFFQH